MRHLPNLLLLLLLGGGCADQLILHPTTAPLGPGPARRLILDRRNGKVLEVWVARSPAASRDLAAPPGIFVLSFSGNESRAERTAPVTAALWEDIAAEVWAINFPGYGGTTGPARLSDIGPAALDAYDALRAHAGTRPVIVAGRSLGCTAALHVAASRSDGVAGLVLHNPPALRTIILREFGWWNLWLIAGPTAAQIPDELNAPVVALNVKALAVFITAAADNVVVPKYQQRVIDAYAGPKRVVRLADAGHDTPIESERDVAAVRAALRWLLPR